eukprot:GGOE01002396.1.p1 GENE.GGOE01002396.1~~GGOE01002396.1.p1  ORF type:complete len:958 (-),score=204.08 GGOE01002396.1:195-3068(-)
MGGEKRIKVACRIRPRMMKLGERYEVECVRKVDEENLVVTQPAEEGEKPKQHFFTFDHVFDELDSQRDIYNEAALDLVDLVLEGTNATILAYGQTGSGKTFTVLGDVEDKGDTVVTPGSGLFLRALTDLFTYKDRSRRTLDVTISLSILEIYIDELRDLLAKKNKLVMREVDDDVTIPNLVTVEVDTLADVYRFYKIANAERSVTATGMNDVSSRSHAIFIVDVAQAARDNPDANPLLSAQQLSTTKKNMRTSRLVLTDLAGSERVKRSGVEGKAMQEAQHINKSLAALGNVVNGLYMESKHIPYRDSKLTRLLRSSFVDANSRILLITNLSPTGTSFNESLSSLRFADRVKGLKANAVAAGDPVAEQEFLEKLRIAEQIAADVRIAQGATDFKIQRPRSTRADVFTNPNYLKECIAEYQSQVKKEEAEKLQREAKEIHDMVRKETEATIEAWRKKNEDMRVECEQAEAEHVQLKKGLETCIADKEQETEEQMNEAKKRKRDRRHAEERIEQIKAELLQAEELEGKILQKQKAAEGEFMDSSGQENNAYEAMAQKWRVQDEAHKRAELFIRKLLVYRAAQCRWLLTKASNQPSINRLQEYKFIVAYSQIQDLIEEKIDHMITWAVEGGPSKNRAAKKSANQAPSPDNSDDEGDDNDQLDYDPGIKPMRQINTHVQSSRAQIAFGREERTQFDEEEADRQYLMGIYDAEGLNNDILKYLQCGTMLLKHCRNGKPHFRKFSISEDFKEFCWVDPEKTMQGRSSVAMADITSIVLGQYSKVFHRNLTEMTEPEFYLSFSLILRGGKRTVDVVAETPSEFEAWLIGLSHVLRMEPIWGKPLDVSMMDGCSKLDPDEKERCSRCHITPQLYLKLKEVVMDRREEVKSSIKLFSGDMEKVYQAVGGIHPPSIDKNGALLMTKGELRYLANIDIFRTCVIWKLFERQKLIYDPSFRPPTPVSTL